MEEGAEYDAGLLLLLLGVVISPRARIACDDAAQRHHRCRSGPKPKRGGHVVAGGPEPEGSPTPTEPALYMLALRCPQAWSPLACGGPEGKQNIHSLRLPPSITRRLQALR